jgi:hypothetical protein
MGVTQGQYSTSGAMTFRDTIMSPPFGTSPWHQFPTQDIGEEPGTGFMVYDDFVSLNNVASTGLWLVTKGTGGTVALSSTSGTQSCGWIQTPTAASASDYIMHTTQQPVFTMQSNMDMAFELSVNVTEAATNASSWYGGFTSSKTSGWIQTSGVPPTTYSGVMFWKATGGLLLKCQSSNGTTQNSSATLATVVSAQTYTFGAYINHNDNVTAIVTPYVRTVTANVTTSVAVGPTINWTIASLSNMYFGFGIMCGSGGTAETLKLDYVQAAQGRFYQ